MRERIQAHVCFVGQYLGRGSIWLEGFELLRDMLDRHELVLHFLDEIYHESFRAFWEG